MLKKWLPYILTLLLGAVILAFSECKHTDKPGLKPSVTTNEKRDDPASHKTDRDRVFDRRVADLEYSNHARCRMECRKISQAEVEEILQDGRINYNKSDLQNARCPRYAVEGITKDDQRVRIIFAQCATSTVVVTVIDLDTEHECHCPGDDDKYRNR